MGLGIWAPVSMCLEQYLDQWAWFLRSVDKGLRGLEPQNLSLRVNIAVSIPGPESQQAIQHPLLPVKFPQSSARGLFSQKVDPRIS